MPVILLAIGGAIAVGLGIYASRRSGLTAAEKDVEARRRSVNAPTEQIRRTARALEVFRSLGRDGLPPVGSRVNQPGWHPWVQAQLLKPTFVAMLARTAAEDDAVWAEFRAARAFGVQEGEPGYEEYQALLARRSARSVLTDNIREVAAARVAGSFATLNRQIENFRTGTWKAAYAAAPSCPSGMTRTPRYSPALPMGENAPRNGQRRPGPDGPGNLLNYARYVSNLPEYGRKAIEYNDAEAPKALWDRLAALKTWARTVRVTWSADCVSDDRG